MSFLKISKFYFLLALVLSLGFVACESDSDDDSVIADKDKTIAEYLEDADQFSTLREAIVQAGLMSAFENEGDEITLFAPNNTAFANAGIDLATVSTEDLKNLLLYHVIMGDNIKDNNLVFEDRYFGSASTAGPNGANLSIMLDQEDNDIRVNGMKIISGSENDFKNGVIYEMGSVLTLPTVVSIVANDGDLENLEGAIGGVDGLSDQLNQSGPITVFAPVNDGFDDISEVVEGLSMEQLQTILTYHVVSGAVMKDDLEDDQAVATLNGESFTIDIDLGILEIKDNSDNETRIKISDIVTTNGIVHIIDDVLLPEDY